MNDTPSPFAPFTPSPPVQPEQPAAKNTETPKQKAAREKREAKAAAKAPETPAEPRQKRKQSTEKTALKFDLQTILAAAAILNPDDQASFEKLVGILSDAGKPGRERLLAAIGKIFE